MSQVDTQKEPRGKAKRLTPRAWSAIKNNLALAGALATLVVAVIRLSGIQELKQGMARQETQSDTCQNKKFEEYHRKMDEWLRQLSEATERGEVVERGEGVRGDAQTCTREILPGLEPKEKGKVVEYLWENELIQGVVEENELSQKYLNCNHNEYPVIELANERANEGPSDTADLSSAVLNGADLRNACLSWVNLSSAELRGANLSGANLSWSDLTGKAKLSGADLSGADLSDALLNEAALRGGDLSEAVLTEAVLDSAFLNGAAVTDPQLNTAWSREGATMPDGSTYYQAPSSDSENVASAIG